MLHTFTYMLYIYVIYVIYTLYIYVFMFIYIVCMYIYIHIYTHCQQCKGDEWLMIFHIITTFEVIFSLF